METSNRNLNEIYKIPNPNRINYNNMGIVQKRINPNNNINNYNNPNIRFRTPKNIRRIDPINNVYSIESKKNIENITLNNASNFLNDQNVNTLNMNILPRNTNQTPKIIVQKIINKEKNIEKFYQPNLTENNLITNKISELQEKRENKDKKGNFQYIIKNVKKINQPMKSDKKEFNGIINNNNNNEINLDEGEKINIKEIREELRLIHDNRKYNYDKKNQKINAGKIPIPQSKKLVDRILGLTDKKEKKPKSRNDSQCKTESKLKTQIIPDNKLYNEILNNKQINMNNIPPCNLRQNIKLIKRENKYKENINQNQNMVIQPIINANRNVINNINNDNNQNLINPLNIKYNHEENKDSIQNQNIPNNIDTQAKIVKIQEESKINNIKQFSGIVPPQPSNNKDMKNVILPPNQQLLNINTQYTNQNIQKLEQNNISNQNKINPNRNIPNHNLNINNNINMNQLYKNNNQNNILINNQNNNIMPNYIFSDEPKNSDEIDNMDKPQTNINITVKKITPIISDQRMDISPLKQQKQNLVENRQFIHPNLNINVEPIQNIKNIQIQQNLIDLQQQKMFINPHPHNNINIINKNLVQNNIDSNINFNQNISNINKNHQTMNNIIPQDTIIQRENIINENINVITNNNIPQNNFANVQKIQPQQIPNNTILGNIIIRDGKAYYLNQIPNNNINSNIIINNNQHNIINNQIQNQNIQSPIINAQNCCPTINNNINNNRQIINNIISNNNYGNIINIPKSPLKQTPQIPNKNQPQFKNCRNVIKKKKVSRVARILQAKDSKQRKPALQYKVERNRPLYAVPPSKKRSVSQGKPFTLINKYYDENYILEDDEEGDEKKEETQNLRIEKNMSDDDENNSN